MYALDTNAILYYLKDDVHAVPVLRQVFAQNTPNTPIFVSYVSIEPAPIITFAEFVGRENVIASADCGKKSHDSRRDPIIPNF